MLSLIFMGTFSATALSLIWIVNRLFGRRRAAEILRGRDPTAQSATELRQPGPAERWEIAAKQAGLNWTARSYATMLIASAAVAMLMALGGAAGPAVLVVAGVSAGPWMVVRYRQQKRAALFSEQLPATLTLAANTIRSGGTMLQAVKAISRQMPDPIRTEFIRVEHALQLQVPLPVALDQARQRIGVEEFAAVVVACKVAGQAGADLDEVLENIAREIIEQRQFQDAMRAASSEGRMSAKIVTAIPIIAGVFFLWKDPHYFAPMMVTLGGQMMLFGSIISIGVGWVTIARITDVRNW